LTADSDSGSDSPFQGLEDDKKGKKFRKRGPKGKRKREDSNEDEEVVAKVQNELTEEDEKEKADSLWAEFCKDMPMVSKSNNTSSSTSNISSSTSNTSSSTSNTSSALTNDKTTDKSSSDQNKKVLINKTYDFAGESVTVAQEVEANSSVANNRKEEGTKGVKRSGGLGGILDQLKKPKINTLQKSLLDWDSFKKDEGIEDELSQHTKSKNTFIERQAFLQRTDVRQFELEKEVRAKNRAQRQLSKN